VNPLEIFQGGSNTDSGAKKGVQCKDINTCIAFIIRNLIHISYFHYQK
jgi:hypothetical protein